MEFEWDPNKDVANLKKHGLDFSTAVLIFGQPVFVISSDRQGEERYRAIGRLGGVIVAVVYTDRGSVRRIISARRARKNEIEAYNKAKQ